MKILKPRFSPPTSAELTPKVKAAKVIQPAILPEIESQSPPVIRASQMEEEDREIPMKVINPRGLLSTLLARSIAKVEVTRMERVEIWNSAILQIKPCLRK